MMVLSTLLNLCRLALCSYGSVPSFLPHGHLLCWACTFQFDLRNLLVVNPHQVDDGALAEDSEEYLKGQAQAAIQSLINR